MKETAYTFAVAKIRTIETNLLNSSDIEQLITASDYDSAIRVLEDKGFISENENEDIECLLKQQIKNTWQLLSEISPDRSQLEFLVVRNDFHNLKAVLKALLSGVENADYFILPSLIDPELIKTAVISKRFNDLPNFLADGAAKTYDVLVRTTDGQLADIMLDAMTLDNIILRAEKTSNNFIKKLAELIAVTANIKLAFRAARTGKDEQFLKTALCSPKTLDKSALINAAKKGLEELINFLSGTAYKEAAEYFKISTTAFEKWCDDIIMSHIESAKYVSFGTEPLIAYYIAKEAEIKTIRIILSCKHNNMAADIIRERVRKLYV